MPANESASRAACPICAGGARIAFSKELNVSCGDYFEGARIYPANLGEVDLLECSECGFAWFPTMHLWDEDRFRTDIYNDAYELCDPPFREERPRKLAEWMSRLARNQTMLDFGGGRGRLCELLQEIGIDAKSYDPFYGDREYPIGEYDIVTAFEVVEHVPDPLRFFSDLLSLTAPGGIIIFSTMLKAMRLAGDWWYASPRNGHVSFHTAKSLGVTLSELGLRVVSVADDLHIAARDREKLQRFIDIHGSAISAEPHFEIAKKWSTFAPIKS